MATQTRTTTEREELPTGSDNDVSDERTLGRLEGQMSILLRNIEEQGIQAREDRRQAREDWRQSREDYRALSARIDRHFYWLLGFCVAIIITIVGSAIGLAIRLG